MGDDVSWSLTPPANATTVPTAPAPPPQDNVTWSLTPPPPPPITAPTIVVHPAPDQTAAPDATVPATTTTTPPPDQTPSPGTVPDAGTTPGQDNVTWNLTPPAPEIPPLVSGTGLWGGLLAGAEAGVAGTARPLTGEAFSDQPLPAPPSDLTLMGRLGYGLGQSSPTLALGTAGALGGGAVGSAVGGPVGGPLGGVIGGAAGFGAGSLVQQMAPAYLAARQRGLSHDDAVDEAWKSSAIAGAFGAVIGAIPGINVFKNTIGNVLLHTFASVPALSAGQTAATRLAAGLPLPSAQEMAEQYGENVVTGGVLAGAHMLGTHLLRPGDASQGPIIVPTPEGAGPTTWSLTPPEPVRPPTLRLPPPTPETPVDTGGPAAGGPPGAPGMGAGPPAVLPQPGGTEGAVGPGTAPDVPPDHPGPAAPLQPAAAGIVPGPAAPEAAPVPAPVAPPGPTAGLPPIPAPVAPPTAPAPVPAPPPAPPPPTPPPQAPPPAAAAPEAPAPAAPAAAAPGSPGSSQTVTTPNGHTADTTYEVVDASTLVPASGTLQPRDRSARLASEQQIAQNAARLDPTKIMASPTADIGAPIVTPGNVVLAGNGRLATIQRAAEQHPEQYQAYKDALAASGYDLSGITTPVLIRRAVAMSPDNERLFAQDSNRSAAMSMSATEQANVDAQGLTHTMLASYNPDLTGGFLAAGNRDFVRSWISTLPSTEHNAVLDADGNLSSGGLHRLQGAVLARAYEDKGTLARALESTDDTTKNLTGALVDAAPAWARLRAGIDGGTVPARLGIATELARAVDLVRQQRDKGITASDMLAQQDVFNPIDPVTAELFKGFYNDALTRPASRQKIGEFLRKYASEAEKQTTGTTLFGGTDQLTPEQILQSARPPPPGAGPTTGRLFAEQPVPDSDQLQRLEEATDRAAKRAARSDLTPRARAAAQHELKTLQKQRDKLQRGLQKKRPTGPTPGGRSYIDYQLNDGTSVYRAAFRDAGEDPDIMVQRPISEQNQVLAQVVKDKFGFRSVGLAPGVDPKVTRDQFLDFYRAGHDMAFSLEMPSDMLGLQGRLTLTMEPMGRSYFGVYRPGELDIGMVGQANSFAHEWMHAVDHYLNDRLIRVPTAHVLLSQNTRDGALVPTRHPVEAAFAKLVNTMFYDEGALAVRVMQLEEQARAVDAQGRPTKAAQEAATQAERIKAGSSKLRIADSRFRASAKTIPGDYWPSVHEMLARASEAWVAWKMTTYGYDPRGVAKPNEAYLDTTDPRLKMTFPKDEERLRIFAALDDLHAAMRAENMLGQGRSEPGPRYDILEPHLWGKVAPPSDKRSWLQKEAQGVKDVITTSRTAALRMLRQDPDNPRVRENIITSSFKALTYTYAAQMEGLLAHKQVPEAAKPHFRWIMDQLVPQVGKRYVGQVFEEEVREFSRKNINKYMQALQDHGLADMTEEQGIAFHHFMTTGETSYPRDPLRPDLDRETIPNSIIQAGGKTRLLLDREFDRNRHVQLNINYARSGYFPRIYNDQMIMGEPLRFKEAATAMHRLIFDDDVGPPGHDPAALLEAFQALDKNTRKGLSPDVQAAMRRLRKLNADLGILRSGLASSPDPDLDRNQMAQIEAEMSQLAEQHHDTIREAYAIDEADNWFSRVNVGGPTDFDTKGPRAGYLKARVLPPEADRIMREFMITDPREAIPSYLMASARKTAYARRFGPTGTDLEDRLKAAGDAGAHGADIKQMREWVEDITGRNRIRQAAPIQRFVNITHAVGSAALMTRAPFTAVVEPVNAWLRTGDGRIAFKALGNLVGEVFRTQSAVERAELADAIGLTTSPLYESALMTRTGSNYDESPVINRFMVRYYRRIGLTQLTNAQKRSVMSASIIGLKSWLRQLDHPDPVKSGYARDELLGLGIDPEMFKPLLKWLEANDFPQTQDLDTPEGQQFARSIVRLTEQIIQDPLKVNKPAMASNPVGRLAFGLTSFNYAFQRNIYEPGEHRVHAAGRRRYRQAREAGRGKVWANIRGAGAGGWAMMILGTGALAMYVANLISGTVREFLTNQDAWDEHMEKGDWDDWMLGLAWQRAGFNLTLDPLVQAASGLKYSHDLSSLVMGAQLAYFADAAGKIVRVYTVPDVATNTADYNAIAGAYDLFGVPALVYMLSMAPGGPLTRAGWTVGLWYSGSRAAGGAVASALVGPKGTKAVGMGGGADAITLGDYADMESLPSLTDVGEGGGPPESGMGLPLGALDDVAQLALRYGQPVWRQLPKPLKIAVGAAIATYGASKLADEFARFTGGTPPPSRPGQPP
jgi:hypothetical protein